MKSPRFEALHGHSWINFSPRDIKFSAMLGLGLHQTWMFTAMFGSEKTFTNDAADVSFYVGLFFTVSLVAFVLGLLVQAPLGERWSHRLFTPLAIVVSTLLGAVSTLSLAGATFSEPFHSWFFVLGSVFSGIATSVLILQWGNIFARFDIPGIVINTSGAFLLAIIFSSFITPQLDGVIMLSLVAAVILLIEGALLLWSFYRRSRVQDREFFTLRSLPAHQGSFVRRVGIPMLAFGVTSGILGQSSLREMLSGSQTFDYSTLVGAVCLSIVVLAVCVVVAHALDVRFLYQSLLPVTAISLLFIPYVSEGMPLACLILLVGYLCFEILMWTTSCELCSTYRFSPLLAFGLSRGCLALGTLFVDILQRSYGVATGESLMLADFSLVAVALVTLIIGYILLPREKDIVTLVGTNEDTPPTGKRKPGRFMQRCQEISDEYLLTNKETEVLFLLAKGRNAASIQEQLYISENTVRTHMKHIYRKLDIHTQQELIDLVDKR